MPRARRLAVWIDKLTNSIELVTTREKFETDVIQLRIENIEFLKRLNWEFDWAAELERGNRHVHALTLKGDSEHFQALASSEDLSDHIYLHLLENAPTNRSPKKLFAGVAGNLIAFLCKES